MRPMAKRGAASPVTTLRALRLPPPELPRRRRRRRRSSSSGKPAAKPFRDKQVHVLERAPAPPPPVGAPPPPRKRPLALPLQQNLDQGLGGLERDHEHSLVLSPGRREELAQLGPVVWVTKVESASYLWMKCMFCFDFGKVITCSNTIYIYFFLFPSETFYLFIYLFFLSRL